MNWTLSFDFTVYVLDNRGGIARDERSGVLDCSHSSETSNRAAANADFSINNDQVFMAMRKLKSKPSTERNPVVGLTKFSHVPRPSGA